MPLDKFIQLFTQESTEFNLACVGRVTNINRECTWLARSMICTRQGKFGGIFMPELHRLGLTDHVVKGFGAMDHLRDTAISRHQDVLNRIVENSSVIPKIRQSQQMLQPYYS